MAETNNDNYNDMTEPDKAPLDYELPTPPPDAEEEGETFRRTSSTAMTELI